MSGYRDETTDDDEVNRDSVRENLRAARPYGCGLATLLALSMSFVIFLGNIMGDCEPGPGCHDNDGIHIMQDLAVALPIAVFLGIAMWFVAALLHAVLRPLIDTRLVHILLIGLTLALAWLAFDPAFETFFLWTTPAER